MLKAMVSEGTEPQINTDKHRLNALSEQIIGAAFEVSNVLGTGFLEKVRLYIIFWFENHREHRGHREKWQPSAFSVYSVVDYLCKYSFFQKKLKSLKNR